MVDLLAPPDGLVLEVDQLPEEVGVDVVDGGGAHLHLRHRDQHLVADDLYLGLVRLARGALEEDEERQGSELEKFNGPIIVFVSINLSSKRLQLCLFT